MTTTKPTIAQKDLINDAAGINKLCASIKRRGVALQSDMHLAACSVLLHVGQHSDVRVVDTLIKAFPDVARKHALMVWFESFGPITFEAGKAAFDKTGKVRLGTAMETPFWKFKVQEGGEYQPINAPAKVDALVKALRADTDKALKAGATPVDHGHLIAALLPYATEAVVQ